MSPHSLSPLEILDFLRDYLQSEQLDLLSSLQIAVSDRTLNFGPLFSSGVSLTYCDLVDERDTG